MKLDSDAEGWTPIHNDGRRITGRVRGQVGTIFRAAGIALPANLKSDPA